MIIPQTFMLMGREFKVVITPKQGIDYHGACLPDLNEIHISKDIPRSKIESVFFHELTHAILAIMGQQELYNDETFIEVFSGLLHQAMISAKGKSV